MCDSSIVEIIYETVKDGLSFIIGHVILVEAGSFDVVSPQLCISRFCVFHLSPSDIDF